MSVSMLIPVHWKKNLVLASMVFPFPFPTRRRAMVIHRAMVPRADKMNTRNEAYSAAGKTWFGWWLVEHYFSYHVNCPDSCGSGEPARGG